MRNSLRGASIAAAMAVGALLGASPAVAQSGGSTPSAAPSGSAGSTASGTATDASASQAPAVAETRTVRLTRSQTRTVQRRISVRADGVFGARSRSAMRRYQSRRDLKRTGRPNIQTLRAMKLKLAERLAAQANRGAATPAPAAAAGDLSAAVAAAREAIGTPYGSGGNGPDSYDCSGLTVMAFKAAGIELPRTSFDQYKKGTEVQKADIQPGDLVFFNTAGPGASHVGVATSATKVVSATTSGVREHAIDDDYWGAAFVGVRRVTS